MDEHTGVPEHASSFGQHRALKRPVRGNDRTYLVKVLGARSAVPVSGPRDRRIAMIAEAQRGQVTRGQLREAAIASSTIGRLVKKGYLLPMHRGVFAVGHRAPIPLGRETAALLAVRAGAVLSHHSAAVLWGMRPSGSGDGLVHVLVQGNATARLAGVRVHRTHLLPSADVRIRDRLPVTSPARALLDIAEVVPPRELEMALDQAIVSRIVRQSDIAELISRTVGRPGRPRLAALLARQAGPALTRSEAEERFLALVREAQLPAPEVNVRIHGYEVDFLWRRKGLAVEIDGFRFHSTRRAFEHDRRKDASLRAAGLAAMRVTWNPIESEPYAVIARVGQALVWAAVPR